MLRSEEMREREREREREKERERERKRDERRRVLMRTRCVLTIVGEVQRPTGNTTGTVTVCTTLLPELVGTVESAKWSASGQIISFLH